MELHHPTLFVTLAAGFGMLAVLLAMAQCGPLGRDPALRAWGLGSWAFLLSYLALLMRGVIPVPLSVLLANLASELGVTLFAAAIHRHLWSRPPPRWLWWCFGAQVALLMAVLPQDQPTRVVVLTISHVLLLLPSLWWLHSAGPYRERLMRAVTATLLTSELLLLFRAIDAALHPQLYDGLVTQGWRQGAAYACTYLFLLGTGYGFVLANLERLASRLHLLARTDALTGCLNRRAADEMLARDLASCAANGRPLTLLLLDLDHFKRINDRYGHPGGDLALQRFADTIRAQWGAIVDDPDWRAEGAGRTALARLGGEEFGLWLPGRDEEAGRQVGERLREAVARIDSLGDPGRPVAMRVSVGVASFAPSGPSVAPPDFSELYGRADRALYRAKVLGRNRVECAGTEGGMAARAAGLRAHVPMQPA